MTRRMALVALIAAAVAAVGLVVLVGDGVEPATLRHIDRELSALVAARPVLAAVIYTLVYASAVLASVPAGALFTVAGGYLFGWFEGIAYTLIAQLTAATALFLLARKALAGWILRRAGHRSRRLQEGFRRNAFSYVLVLRMIGVFPTLLVSGVPGALGVPLRTYLLGSTLGLVPGTIVYAGIGAGLGNLRAAERALSPGNVLTPELIVGLVGLVVLALLPIVYRRIQAQRHGAQTRRAEAVDSELS
jgi:uncharacterized membrane protein YdjX (TVP38/TMEM64 family)